MQETATFFFDQGSSKVFEPDKKKPSGPGKETMWWKFLLLPDRDADIFV
jgi:hypothetical protein